MKNLLFENEEKNLIPILMRAAKVLETVSKQDENLSINQMARALDIPQATCFRIIKTLIELEWIEAKTNGGYQISVGLINLVKSYHNYQWLVDLVQNKLEELVSNCGLSAKLSVKENNEARTIAVANSSKSFSITSQVGSRFPITLGSSGAILMSDLDNETFKKLMENAPNVKEIEKKIYDFKIENFCFDFGNFHPNVYTVSSALRGKKGEVIAVITILGLPEEFKNSNIERLKTLLMACVEECNTSIRTG